MNFSRIFAAFIAVFAIAQSADAQWQTPNHSTPQGRGAGVVGFGSIGPCAAGIPLIGAGSSADAGCGPIDLSGAGVVGNLGVGHLNGGTGASSTTFWNGAGAWATPPATSLGYSVVAGDPTGVTDSTVAFQTAVNACRNGAQAKCNVLIPPGIYQISSVNCTNMSGLTIKGTGSLTYSTLVLGSTGGVSMFDCSGSEGVRFQDLEISTKTGIHPGIGILIGPTTVTVGMDNIAFDNVGLQGSWSTAALYLDRLGSSYMKKVQVVNNYGIGTSYGVVFTANNVLSIASTYATTAAGSSQTSDWNLYDIDFHAYPPAGGSSFTEPLFLDGAEGFRFWGGNISCTGCDILVRIQDEITSPTNQIIFSGIGFYNDAAPNYQNIFGGNGGLRGVSFEQAGMTNVGTTGSAFSISGPNNLSTFPIYGVNGSTQQVFLSGTYAGAGTIYLGPQGSNASEGVAAWNTTNRAVMARMYVTLSAAPGGSTTTVTARYALGATPITVSMTGATNTASDSVHWAEVPPLGLVDVQVVSTGGAATVHVTIEFVQVGAF